MAWELHVKRLGLQQKAGQRVRTYGAYQVIVDGQPNANLAGHICECTGPGDNTVNGKKKHVRIHEGKYALSTQFGDHYRSVNYSADATHPPAVLVLGTDDRSAILVHPAHPPTLYLSSIGCFNPTKPITAKDNMDFWDSRDRVIAIIDSLKAHDPDAFEPDKIGTNTPITDAFIIVEGEPMTPVSAGAVA
jgi:hypothetical protein